MKRSRHLTLTLMAASVALTGCKEAVTGAIAESPEHCTSFGFASDADCVKAMDDALSRHLRVAPRFDSGEECVQFGTCSPVVDASGATLWRPSMSGYLMTYAPAIAGRVDCNEKPRDEACHAHPGRVVVVSVPLYRDARTGEYFTASNGNVGRSTGLVRGEPGRATAPIYANTYRRGGFGSVSRSGGSFGG